jgi:ribosomal protein S18 acetylase RimI-like enzyme
VSLFAVRPGKPDDWPYLAECWIQSDHKHTRSSLGWLKGLAMKRLADKRNIIRIACDPQDHDAILGFCVIAHDGRTLMAYTRMAARGLGIQRALFRKAG